MDNPVAMVVPTLDEEKARAILRETWRSRKVWRDREWIGADLEIVVDEKQERFSRTVNRGLRNVLSVSWSQTWGEFDPVGYDYIGIMSDDCRPVTDGWLREMVDALEADEHLGFVSPAMPCRTVGMKEQTGPTAEREVREIFAVPYGCVLIRREVFTDVGLLDPSMRHYASDTDHQYRARAFGWKSAFLPHVWVEREIHPPRQPMWSEDRAVFMKRWGR